MHPYKNKNIDNAKRVADLLSRMTLQEKIGQLCQSNEKEPMRFLQEFHVGSYLNINDLDELAELQEAALGSRLGIPILFELDAVHGHAFIDGGTVFPSQMFMGSTWNPALIERVGAVVGRECAATGMHMAYAPTLCVSHDPRWGRLGETFAEDPYLVGEMANAKIQGLQKKTEESVASVAANAKHFAGYGASIGGRDSCESNLSKRKLLDYYLPPFKKALKNGCHTIMTGYHSNDGVPCSADKWLLRTVLRDEWQWDGVVITDWDNIGHMVGSQQTVENIKEGARIALLAGNDIMMSTLDFPRYAFELVEEGAVPQACIDEACARVLLLKFRLGLFDCPIMPDLKEHTRIISDGQHQAVNKACAEEGVILLKNENDILPLPGADIKIALVGPNINKITAQLGDWSFGEAWATFEKTGKHADTTITIEKAFLERVGNGVEVEAIQGIDLLDSTYDERDQAIKAAEQSDVIVACVGDTMAFYGENKDRAEIDFPGEQLAFLKELKATGKPLIVIMVNGKPISSPWLKENADAILESFNSGNQGGAAIADIVFGACNPSGKLTLSLAYDTAQAPVNYDQLPGWHTYVKEGARRSYIDKPKEPLYPFGFGLSYTTFEYSQLQVLTPEIKDGEDVHVQVCVTNTGKRDGQEVVQLYINDVVSSVVTPIKQLKAFTKIFLAAGEQRLVELTVPFEELSFVDETLTRKVESGDFEVMVGPSSEDSRLLKGHFKTC